MIASKRIALKTLAACAIAAGALGTFGAAQAQTKLKWAHVYETSEPFHKYSVWAGEEIKKRTNGRYEIQVFPASSLGKEADINQGLTLGTVDIVLRETVQAFWESRRGPIFSRLGGYFETVDSWRAAIAEHEAIRDAIAAHDAAAARAAMHAHLDRSHQRFSASWRRAKAS